MQAKLMTWTTLWGNMNLCCKPNFAETTALLLNSTSKEVLSIDLRTATEETGS